MGPNDWTSFKDVSSEIDRKAGKFIGMCNDWLTCWPNCVNCMGSPNMSGQSREWYIKSWVSVIVRYTIKFETLETQMRVLFEILSTGLRGS